MYITIQTACFEQWDLVLLLVNNVTPYATAQTFAQRQERRSRSSSQNLALAQDKIILANLVEIDRTSK